MIFDPVFFLFLIPGLAFMLWAQRRVRKKYQKFSAIGNTAGLTGAQVARRLLDAHGLHDVAVERSQGELSDHYDPRDRVVRLSEGVHDAPTVAALGISAHEVGHAIQHAQAYAPLKARTAIVPVVSIGSNAGMIVLMIALFIGSLPLGWLGVGLFALATLFALITLPVEFDATRRAKLALAQAGISGRTHDVEDAEGVGEVLDAAAWTYIAGFAASLLTLLYYIQLMTGMRSSEN
ncbi:MAG: zinc metallopeptidase [Thermomicrobiales bacterium]